MNAEVLNNRNRREMTVDVLKSTAALLVFLLHGKSYLPAAEQISGCLAWISCFPAWGGVWIFLILSGYGIGLGFFTGKYSLQGSGRYEKLLQMLRFYIDRIIKIAPLYYLYCFIFEMFSDRLFFWHNPKIFFRMFTFTFNGNGGISGLGHLWYISMAVQLYLFMPFIYLAADWLCQTKRASAAAFIVILIAGMALRTGLYRLGCEWYAGIYTNCLTNLDLIVSGMLTAKVKVSGCLPDLGKVREKLRILGAVLFVVLVLYNCFIYYAGTDRYYIIYRYILPSAYMCICTLLILSSGNRRYGYRKTRMLINTAVCRFSKYSYAFYIFHIGIFEYMKKTLVSTDWFCNCSPNAQYFIFFSAAFILLLFTSAVFTEWSARGIVFFKKKSGVQ